MDDSDPNQTHRCSRSGLEIPGRKVEDTGYRADGFLYPLATDDEDILGDNAMYSADNIRIQQGGQSSIKQWCLPLLLHPEDHHSTI